MARGWDSKAVEEQIEAAHTETQTPKEQTTAEQAARKRERQNLELARKRLLHRLEASGGNPAYEKLLRDALAELDAKVAKLK